jgi:hypothetical protein
MKQTKLGFKKCSPSHTHTMLQTMWGLKTGWTQTHSFEAMCLTFPIRLTPNCAGRVQQSMRLTKNDQSNQDVRHIPESALLGRDRLVDVVLLHTRLPHENIQVSAIIWAQSTNCNSKLVTHAYRSSNCLCNSDDLKPMPILTSSDNSRQRRTSLSHSPGHE